MRDTSVKCVIFKINFSCIKVPTSGGTSSKLCDLINYCPMFLFYNPHENVWKAIFSTILWRERKKVPWVVVRLTTDAGGIRNIRAKPSW